MKRLFFTYLSSLFLVLSLGFAQEPDYAAYIRGSAEVDSATVTFYLENASSCMLDTVDVRVAHNSVYLTTDEATLHVNLEPGEVGTFVMKLSRVASPDWQWAIDGAGLSDCAEAGQKTFNKISFGEAIPLPASAATSSPGPVIYTIEKGDTLFAIADKFGVTARQIMDANGLTSEALIFGRTLEIPVITGAASAAPATTGTEFALHTVASGDTLYSISQSYGTTVALIEEANCMAPGSVLILGNQLRIPPAGVTEIANQCG